MVFSITLHTARKYVAGFLGCLILLLLTLNVSAGNSDSIEYIRKIYSDTNDIIKSRKVKEVSYYLSDKGWEVRTKEGDSGNNDAVDLQEEAKSYQYGNSVIKAVLNTASPSGDWRSTVEYYFYDNARTAFIFQTFETFSGYNVDEDKELPEGPYIIENRIYLNKEGRVIKQLKKAFIASSKKDIPIKYLRQVDLDIVYKGVADLPFGSLLKSR